MSTSRARRGSEAHSQSRYQPLSNNAKSPMDARVEVTIKMMHRSMADRVSLTLLSRSVNLSPGRLRELFKKETGRSPMQYLRGLRMQRAEHLLRSTFLSVKQVAFASGVKHVSSFVSDFKKRHGLTPSEFRARRKP
jgi:transcriptional regulator GlxA family with amidase domain